MWPLITVRDSAGKPCQDATTPGNTDRNETITIITVITDSYKSKSIPTVQRFQPSSNLLCSLLALLQLCCVCVKKKGFKINPEQIIGCFEFGAIFERAVYWLQLSRDFFDRFHWFAVSPFKAFKKAITTNQQEHWTSEKNLETPETLEKLERLRRSRGTQLSRPFTTFLLHLLRILLRMSSRVTTT